MITLRDGSKPHPKSRTTVLPQERVTLLYAGGGGYGDPKTRNRDAVREDVRNGTVSPDAARDIYGLA